MKDKLKEENERIIRLLRTAMRLLGFTNREIERRLSYTPSYLTRLFSGQIELRFEHIVDIVKAMGMTVPEFFRFAYPGEPEELSEAAQQLDTLLEELRPSRSPWKEEELRRFFRDNLEKLLRHYPVEPEALKKPKPGAGLRESPRLPAPPRPKKRPA
jgi:transcriptional regulator with XRE-family HTH domain